MHGLSAVLGNYKMFTSPFAGWYPRGFGRLVNFPQILKCRK